MPPSNHLPCSLARRANGTSSADSACARCFARGFFVPFFSLTQRAREHSASLSIPASVLRRRRLLDNVAPSSPDGVDMKDWRKRMTSSRMSSSQRLSLSPSDARTRMSSACTGTVNTWASRGRVADAGPSWTGVLNFKFKSACDFSFQFFLLKGRDNGER